MSLERFDDGAAETVSALGRSLEEVNAWCSLTEVPVPAQVVIGWAADQNTEAYVLREHGQIVAYGEIWIDEDEVELAHLIVDPTCRGEGLGRALTMALVDLGRAHHQGVYLRVVPENTAARRCYESAGFARVDEAQEAAWNERQPRTYVWMAAG